MTSSNGGAAAGPFAATVDGAFRAVAARATADELRRVIEAYAAGGATPRECEERRLAAVNYPIPSGCDDPAYRPLFSALFVYGRCDLVAVLLEAGADAAAACGPNCSALALALHCGLTDTLRALLRTGRCQADEELRYQIKGFVEGVEGVPPAIRSARCRAVHLAIVPPVMDDPEPPPRLDALAVLVREYGADVNARDQGGHTPLHWVIHSESPRAERERAVDALLELGADLEVACAAEGATVLSEAAGMGSDLVPYLLSKGASADASDDLGWTPLMRACRLEERDARVNVPLLLAASSQETLRATEHEAGLSALDCLIANFGRSCPRWTRDAIEQLVEARVPFVHPFF